MEKLLAEQKEELGRRKEQIENYFENKRQKEVEQEKKRRALELIQLRFEEWYNIVGCKQKKKKRRKAK